MVADARADQRVVAVQLKPMVVPALGKAGHLGRADVTPYVEIHSMDDLPRLCGRWPRVVEAILQSFEKHPVDLAHLAVDIADRQNDLREHIEGSIGKNIFAALYLTPGAVRRGEGTEMLDHEAATRECQPIAYLPWEQHKHKASSLAEQATADIEKLRHHEAAKPEDHPFLQAQTEAEVEATLPRKAFPEPPSRRKAPSWLVLAIILVGTGLIMMLIGCYIGYHIGKIRRDRRRKDRRKRKKDRREMERRLKAGPAPDGVERRDGTDRRSAGERRKQVRRKGPRGGDAP